MKDPRDMSNDQIKHWLKKTMTSVGGYQRHTNGMINCQRAYDLVDRYAILIDAAKEKGIWIEYCDETGCCPSHDEYDIFA